MRLGFYIALATSTIFDERSHMNSLRIAATCTLALFCSLAYAQSSETPVESTAAKQDCVKRHDHGAERQAPSSRKDCKTEKKAAMAKPQAKKEGAIQGHDHGKFHKNQ
jgi:hypothetical protein